jgi:hypothetical protein
MAGSAALVPELLSLRVQAVEVARHADDQRTGAAVTTLAGSTSPHDTSMQLRRRSWASRRYWRRSRPLRRVGGHRPR